MNPYEQYYISQAGGKYNHYSPVFRGIALQEGRGIGSLFKSIFKIVKPILYRGAKHLAKEGASTIADIAGDVAHDRNLKESVITRGKEGISRIRKQVGLGRRKKRLKAQPKFTCKKKTKKRDIFS